MMISINAAERPPYIEKRPKKRIRKGAVS